MAIDLTDQDAALRAASKIISKCYSAAESVDGAYQLTNEKIKTLYRGIRGRQSDFVSTEAIAYVLTQIKQMTIEEVKAGLNRKTETEIVELKRKIRTTHEYLWDRARKFDLTDHGGHKFVHQSRDGSKIVFLFTDNRKLEFDLSACSKSMQSWFSSQGAPVEPNEVIKTPIIAEKIFEITKWPLQFIKLALAGLKQNEIATLYANHSLSQFRTLLVQEARRISVPINKISVQDISEVIQSLLDELDE